MKKYKFTLLLILSFVLIFSACNQKEEKITTEPEKEVEVIEEPKEDDGELSKEFDAIYSNDDITLNLVKFVEENINKVQRKTGTDWLLKLEDRLLVEREGVMNSIFEKDEEGKLLEIDGTSRYFTEEKVEDIDHPQLKELVENTLNSYYRLINLEGNFYPILDYKKLSKHNEFIDEDLGKFFEIKAMDSENQPFSDGGRVISIEDLQIRIIEIEKYLKQYPEGPRNEELIEDYSNKLSGYMRGLPNTPIYSFEDSKINPEVLESFEETSQIEDLITGRILKEYLEEIKNKDFVIDQELLSRVEHYVEKAKDEIKE